MKNSEHIIDGQFQSDKYPDTPRGLIPFKPSDKMAQDLLWEYARRRESVDAQFSTDLRTVLLDAGFDPSQTLGVDVVFEAADDVMMFVEIENPPGTGIKFGTWQKRGDYDVLRISERDFQMMRYIRDDIG